MNRATDREPAAPRMRPLLGPEGLAALDALVRQRPLVAFDFDGTLAPIVARPERARVPPGVARRLAALADLRARLGFVPQFLVGNHGAECDTEPAATAAHRARLDALRCRLAAQAAALAAHGVVVEDKGASIALHYRLARDRAAAAGCIAALLGAADASLRVFGGKQVVNVAPADAPDKAAAKSERRPSRLLRRESFISRVDGKQAFEKPPVLGPSRRRRMGGAWKRCFPPHAIAVHPRQIGNRHPGACGMPSYAFFAASTTLAKAEGSSAARKASTLRSRAILAFLRPPISLL